MSELHDAAWAAIPPGAEPEGFALRRAFLLERVVAGQEVLDLGCGAGGFSVALREAGARPTGADVASEALRRAARALGSPASTHDGEPDLAGAGLHLVGEGEPLPFADNAFDVVWAGEVIEHVADVAPWLSEVRRVLRPRGTLLLSTPDHGRVELIRLALSRRRFAEHFDPRSDHLRFLSAPTLRELLEDLGFDVAELRARQGTLLARAVRG